MIVCSCGQLSGVCVFLLYLSKVGLGYLIITSSYISALVIGPIKLISQLPGEYTVQP